MNIRTRKILGATMLSVAALAILAALVVMAGWLGMILIVGTAVAGAALIIGGIFLIT